MATLCPGTQYGLSSQKNFSETKELIFVKLTDSSLRAIEEYVRNRNKYNIQQTPTIQFLGNEGQLAFPSANSTTTSFSFSVSTTQDMEGPGGSFECITQNGPPRGPLELLNPIPKKIRIHANDDIYAATKQRMTVAEETQKNKCTREIKPTQNDIGRKVKVKQPPTSGRISMPQIPPARLNGNSNGSNHNDRTAPSHPSMRDSLLKSSYQAPNPPASKPPSSNGLPPANNGVQMPQHHLSSNGLGSNHVSSTKPPQNKPTQPDISKRPLKERLIHLLALRPYKKVEIFERLNREGLREKNSMSSVLKQVSFMKDNAYHLNRACWHDVRENWPFYTESEKQILKRRKPQNLTPPGSSDSASSGSGQSPTSTHPGSPPPPVTTSTKRPGYYDGADGFPTKRQRVSHYKKPTEPTVNPPPAENKSQRRPITDSRDSSNMNPRSRESPSTTTVNQNHQAQTNGHHLSNGYTNGSTKEKRSALSDEEDEELMNNSRKRHCDSYNRVSYDGHRQEPLERRSPYENGHEDRRELVDYSSLDVASVTNHQNGEMYPPDRWMPETKREVPKYERDVSSTGAVRVSPDSQTEPMPALETTAVDDSHGVRTEPDYVTEYTPIRSYDQRKRYKDDFNTYYNEYKELHEAVDRVSRRFAELDERLKQENERSPHYKDLKKQIMREYKEIKKNPAHHRNKARFQYLHEKLSHIKHLVKMYDDSITNQQPYTNHRY